MAKYGEIRFNEYIRTVPSLLHAKILDFLIKFHHLKAGYGIPNSNHNALKLSIFKASKTLWKVERKYSLVYGSINYLKNLLEF